MSRKIESRRALAAVGVVLVSAAVMFALFMGSGGLLFFIPLAPLFKVINNTLTAYLLVFVAVPLAGVVFWRTPWWIRWVWLGILLSNLTLMMLLGIGLGSSGA
ncbi:hypothetical protein [Pseudonocardia spinosispora]|uniref:hypothetical protein n=1 Tax=Pseudonocardia spinosispora TaxID=103441 RepID=UPI0012EB1745|nr:hypothetical protein [Pseudonocardia spinosispora]